MKTLSNGALVVATVLIALPTFGTGGYAGTALATTTDSVQLAQLQDKAMDTVKEKATEAVQDEAKKQMMKGGMPDAGGAMGMPETPTSSGDHMKTPEMPGAPSMPGKDAMPGGDMPKVPGQ